MEKDSVIRSFRDLRVWQGSMDLVERVYLVTQRFPKHETFGLAAQIQRAAVSIPSNIAEGYTRNYSREYLRHLSIARASLAELQTQLEIARRLKYCPLEQLDSLFEQVDSLGKQLFTLWKSLAKNLNP